MSLENLSSEAFRFLGKIKKKFKDGKIEGYVLLIKDSVDEEKKSMGFVVKSVEHKEIILRLENEIGGFILSVYPFKLGEDERYCRIY